MPEEGAVVVSQKAGGKLMIMAILCTDIWYADQALGEGLRD